MGIIGDCKYFIGGWAGVIIANIYNSGSGRLRYRTKTFKPVSTGTPYSQLYIMRYIRFHFNYPLAVGQRRLYSISNAFQRAAQLTQSRSCASVATRDECPFFRGVVGSGRIQSFTWPILLPVSSQRGRNAIAVSMSFSSCLTSTGWTIATSLRDGAA